VLAAYSAPLVVFLLVGGIWADRLPRHHVMVASSVASGVCQAAIAALLFSGQAEVWHLIVLAAISGAASSFFFPAQTGIVPQTVSEPLLQQANALLRLSRSGVAIVGAGAAGLVIAASSPAFGIAVDAATFLAAAAILSLMRIPAALRMEKSSFFEDLALGWREFSSRSWLWAIVLQFGFVNAVVVGAEGVLGPVVANEHLHGPAGWGLVLTAQAIGLIVGGLILLRARPTRLLLVATLGYLLAPPLLFGLAVPLPLAGIIVLAFVAGIGAETFGVLWDTAVQQEIPQDRLSRVSSYDALGSWALMPLGLAAIGPISELVGTEATLIGCGVVSLTATLSVLVVGDVRTLRRRQPLVTEPALEAAT
jgi:hypothetical protein